MTHKTTVLEFIKNNKSAFCDDCISKSNNIFPRQTIYQICNLLAGQGLIQRASGLCDGCGKHKKLSRIGSEHFPAMLYNAKATLVNKEAPTEKPWYWEGNLQSKLVTWLAGEGYKIRSVADTATRATGVDIVAEDPYGEMLWINIKGYPETMRHEQARHYFASAIFDLILYRNESASVKLGLGLPAGFTTYSNLAKKIQWLKGVLPFDLFWIEADGNIRRE